MWAKTFELEKILIGRLPYGSDLIQELNKFCQENDIRTGEISIIGSIQKAKLGFYNQKKQEYIFLDNDFLCKNTDSTFEIASANGNISIKDDKPFVHLHIVITDIEGKAFGGHVVPGTIIYACEFIIHVYKGEDLVRFPDEKTKLPSWQNP